MTEIIIAGAEQGIEAGGEMNAKKIAEKLREIASFCAPDEGCTNAIYDALTAIIDELDPPEPKPLLADAKAGDLCQRRDGKYVQVESYSNDRPCPVMCKSDIGGQDCFTLDGRNHNAVNNDKDIIHTEPLAEVGTAEWARQMMKLGNKVRNRDWDDGTYEKSLLYCQLIGETIKYNEGCSAFDVCLSDWEAPYIKNTGWQLYAEPEPEPEPKPAYAVEDWVEFIDAGGHKSQGKYLSKAYDNAILVRDIIYNTRCVVPTTKITRKLDPSEVIVKIGCLEGTIERHDGNPQYWFKLRSSEYNYALISIDMLDTPTRELVESLLKAQEEK